jgi:hypothetical protein
MPDSLSRSSYQTTAQSDLAQDFHSNGVQVPSDEPAETTMSVPGQLQPSEGSAVLHSATEEEIAREAGGGKVRGPNGRYLPKNTTSPKPTKSRRSTGGPKAKSLRKCMFFITAHVCIWILILYSNCNQGNNTQSTGSCAQLTCTCRI